MPNKHTYAFIASEFDKNNCILLSKDYVNAKIKLKYLCPNNHIHYITWSDFHSGYGCPYCAGNKKLGIAFIKEAFRDKGYILISKKYVNSSTKLHYRCIEGHTNYISWDNFKAGHGCKECAIKQLTLTSKQTVGENTSNWRGGVSSNNLPLYATYNHTINKYQQTYKITKCGLELLGVACHYCNKVFTPSTNSVNARIGSLLGRQRGENNFYCSAECKKACSIYRQVKYTKGFKLATSREVQPQLRKLVLERDNWTCQRCNKTEVELHCHHIDPVINNPIESADMDNCVTLCKDCHKRTHKMTGCSSNALRCLNE